MSDESVATKEHGGEEYDALETLKPGEGVFPLQYGDPLAILPAKLWARLARRFGLDAKDPAVRDKYLRKATMAENAVWEMQEYQKGQAPVEGRRASYNDQAAVAVDFGDQVKARKAMIANVSALHNAAGIAKAVEEAIGDDHAPERQALLGVIGQLNAVAVAIDPRRDNERT